MSIKNSKEGKS